LIDTLLQLQVINSVLLCSIRTKVRVGQTPLPAPRFLCVNSCGLSLSTNAMGMRRVAVAFCYEVSPKHILIQGSPESCHFACERAGRLRAGCV